VWHNNIVWHYICIVTQCDTIAARSVETLLTDQWGWPECQWHISTWPVAYLKNIYETIQLNYSFSLLVTNIWEHTDRLSWCWSAAPASRSRPNLYCLERFFTKIQHIYWSLSMLEDYYFLYTKLCAVASSTLCMQHEPFYIIHQRLFTKQNSDSRDTCDTWREAQATVPQK